MKKSSILLITLLLLINNSAFANEQNIKFEKEKSVEEISEKKQEGSSTPNESLKTKEDILHNNDEKEKTDEKIDIDDNEKKVEKSQKKTAKKDKIKEEKKEKEDLWSEKISGKYLYTLKDNLEKLQNVYNINYKAYRIGNAINDFEKAENSQKRNNTLLQDLSRKNIFSVYASLYIFPELVKINIQHFINYLASEENNITDEISETPEELEKIINQVSEKIAIYKKVNKTLEKLVLDTENNISSLSKTNKRTNNLTKLGFYFKNTNESIFGIVDEQIGTMSEIADQLILSIEYAEKQIDFIKKHNLTISEMGKYLAEIRSIFKDFEKFIENYEYKHNYNFNILLTVYQKRLDRLTKLIGKEEIREGRIKQYIKTVNFTEISNTIRVFNAKDYLDKFFELFEMTEIDKKLYKQLFPYIDNSSSWQSRFKEDDSEKDENKQDKKIKPKLIDFEEEEQ